jgi:phosphoribosylformylglycinamidine cyclo-ligase
VEEPAAGQLHDGVGTKLAIAQAAGQARHRRHRPGRHGGRRPRRLRREPLFLQDYIACGQVVPERIAEIVGGIATGCELAGCALVGGETAEHPGLMAADHYDIAGTGVGVGRGGRPARARTRSAPATW